MTREVDDYEVDQVLEARSKSVSAPGFVEKFSYDNALSEHATDVLDDEFVKIQSRADAAERHLLELLNVLEARTTQRDAMAAEILSPNYPNTAPDYVRPETTHEKSYGGGDCSKHGRWYGHCECCVVDYRRASDRHTEEWQHAKRARLEHLARGGK